MCLTAAIEFYICFFSSKKKPHSYCIILWVFWQAWKISIAKNERKTNYEYLPTIKSDMCYIYREFTTKNFLIWLLKSLMWFFLYPKGYFIFVFSSFFFLFESFWNKNSYSGQKLPSKKMTGTIEIFNIKKEEMFRLFDSGAIERTQMDNNFIHAT